MTWAVNHTTKFPRTRNNSNNSSENRRERWRSWSIRRILEGYYKADEGEVNILEIKIILLIIFNFFYMIRLLRKYLIYLLLILSINRNLINFFDWINYKLTFLISNIKLYINRFDMKNRSFGPIEDFISKS
jgi:hypothetical protein